MQNPQYALSSLRQEIAGYMADIQFMDRQLSHHKAYKRAFERQVSKLRSKYALHLDAIGPLERRKSDKMGELHRAENSLKQIEAHMRAGGHGLHNPNIVLEFN